MSVGVWFYYCTEAGAAALQPAVLTVEQLNRFLSQFFCLTD